MSPSSTCGGHCLQVVLKIRINWPDDFQNCLTWQQSQTLDRRNDTFVLDHPPHPEHPTQPPSLHRRGNGRKLLMGNARIDHLKALKVPAAFLFCSLSREVAHEAKRADGTEIGQGGG